MIWTQGREFKGYQAEVYRSYSSLQDYLWKSPRFIETEIEAEKAKVKARYPDEGSPEERERNRQLKQLRIRHESAKLFSDFPILIGEANLFLTLAWFEKRLNRLARFADSEFGTDYHTARGNGPKRYFDHFKSVGIQCHQFEPFERVSHAIRFRNCLVHASGDINLSRDSAVIRKAVADRLFMPQARRAADLGMHDDQDRPEVWIDGSQLGVSFYYSMRVAMDAFVILIHISDKIPAALSGQDKLQINWLNVAE